MAMMGKNQLNIYCLFRPQVKLREQAAESFPFVFMVYFLQGFKI